MGTPLSAIKTQKLVNSMIVIFKTMI